MVFGAALYDRLPLTILNALRYTAPKSLGRLSGVLTRNLEESTFVAPDPRNVLGNARCLCVIFQHLPEVLDFVGCKILSTTRMLVSGGPTLPLSPSAVELERRAGGREGLLANLTDLVGGGTHRHPGC